MYIKQVVLDGFKSYAQRTEINGFDPLFNAITGLNGSGKSNILDAICFLLGISNLSQVTNRELWLAQNTPLSIYWCLTPPWDVYNYVLILSVGVKIMF